MVVQYKPGTRSLCNDLRPQYHVPVCQRLPAEPVEATVVAACFAALAPVELEAYQRACAAQPQTEAARVRAHAQQLQRLRDQAALAPRHFAHVDPANRLVAAEVAHRWETARRARPQAADARQRHPPTRVVAALPADLRAAFSQLGQKLPGLWAPPVLSRAQKKAVLRCLLEQVVVQRGGRDQVPLRSVWRGGEVPVYDLPIPVGSRAELSSGQELERRVLALHAAGNSAQDLAAELSAAGFRSPLRHALLVSTVKGLRLKPRGFLTPHPSHPRQIAGALTVPQLAQRLGLSVHWGYDRLPKGQLRLQKDPTPRLFLFPAHPTTLALLTHLRAGHRQPVGFGQE